MACIAAIAGANVVFPDGWEFQDRRYLISLTVTQAITQPTTAH